MHRSERGAVLLEVLVAVTILAVVGQAATSILLQSTASLRAVQSSERAVLDASRLLSALSLLTHDDLDRRRGIRRVGPYEVEISAMSGSLFVVSVDGPELTRPLTTILYRASPSR